MEDIINVILWAAVLQGFFLALLYIFSKKYKSFSNFLLGMFLISLLMEALNTILPYTHIGNYNISGYFTMPEVKVFMPLFFMHFVLEKIGSSHKYKLFLKFNYVFGVLISALTLVNLYLHFFNSSTLLKSLGFGTLDQIHLYQQAYATLLAIFAISVAIKETYDYQNIVKQEYSDLQLLQIRWLWQIIIMLIPATLLWAINVVRIIMKTGSYTTIELITWGFVALFLYFFSYKAHQNPDLFKRIPKSVLKENRSAKQQVVEYKCSVEQSQKIVQLMQEQEYFLDQNLTISQFAKSIDISPRLISSCVNSNLGYNFNEWVNNFRVDKAREIIENDKQNSLSIEGVGLDSGFKSRSAMYAAFKKKLGKSPGHFRKNK